MTIVRMLPGFGLVVLLTVSASCTTATSRPRAGPPTASPTHAVSSSAAALGDEDLDGIGGASATPAPVEARTVAEAFVRAWARPDLTPTQWLTGVRPFAAPRFAELLATVDPSRVPAHTVTGPAVVVSSTTAVVVVDVPTDTGTTRVICNRTPDSWLVTGIADPEPR